MKKSNLITLLLTIITSFFIISGQAIADDISADEWITTSGNTFLSNGGMFLVDDGDTDNKIIFNFTSSGGRFYLAPYDDGSNQWGREFGYDPNTNAWYVENGFQVTTGSVGIGRTPDSRVPLYVYNNALNTDTYNYSIHSYMRKTAGASDFNDPLRALSGAVKIEQPGGEVGVVYGTFTSAILNDGTIGNTVSGVKSMYGVYSISQVNGGSITGSAIGGLNNADINGGIIDNNVFGTYSNVDIESSVTSVGGDVYGHYIYIDADKDPSGKVYGLYLRGRSNVDYGFYQNDSAPNYFGGSLGIGTTDPGSFKLAVEGKIGAREIVVTDTAWADHVFENNYKLLSLNQVESYIKENKHLPDIPSAKQVEEEGLSMADMMAKQMQKIEELTLYVIEQNKQIASLKEENEEIKQKLEKLVN